MTKTRLLELLDEAESVYAHVRISADDGRIIVPIERDAVRSELVLDQDWWDNTVDFIAVWDEKDKSLYLGASN